MNYSAHSVRDWISRTLGIQSEPSKGEIQTHCPECGGDVFYFNTVKQVGVCHRASCDYRPNLFKLIELIGFGPSEAGYYDQEIKTDTEKPVDLPGWPIVKMMGGQLLTSNESALQYLRSRDIPDHITLNWGLTSDGERIYLPIGYEGVVYNYNSRILPACAGAKYLYKPGAKTSLYLLGWDECKLWDRLSIVENSFVSLALRNRISCTSVFGSSLSDVQANLIAGTKIKEVAILWDEGADKKAEKAVKKLHSLGVNAAYWKILGQPDDYPVELVEEWATEVYEAAALGTMYKDFRGECRGI